MPVVIRLQRVGTKKAPVYRVVAADSRRATSGTIIERLGHFNPRGKEPVAVLSEERILHWLKTGAQASDTVRTLLTRKGIWKKRLSK